MFNVGDVVEWESQSSKYVKKKKGVVVEVIEPMVVVFGSDEKWFKKHKNKQYKSGSRQHTSYIVECDGKSYWPRVKYLRSASK